MEGIVGMERRSFLSWMGALALATGCRGKQYAKVLDHDDKSLVGSHAAGVETWEPLIQTSVAQLLGRQVAEVQPASLEGGAPGCKKICFVGVENRSAEELGDFREQIYQKIDTCINESRVFEMINTRFVEAGLRQCRLRPDDLFVPANQRQFVAIMEKLEHPFDYLLWAVVTTGTTKQNKSYQRDYTLTLELVDIQNGHTDKETAELSKGYHKTPLGKLKH